MRQRLFNDVEVFSSVAIAASIFAMSRSSGAVRIRPQKTMVKAGTMVEVVQSIHFSAAARACRSCG